MSPSARATSPLTGPAWLSAQSQNDERARKILFPLLSLGKRSEGYDRPGLDDLSRLGSIYCSVGAADNGDCCRVWVHAIGEMHILVTC